MTINLSPRYVTSLPSLPFTRVFLPSLPLGRGDERPSERSCLSPPFFILPYGKHFSSENLRLRKRNTRDLGKTNIPEAVSSSPRRSARAPSDDDYPRDFGPRIAYAVGLVSDFSQPSALCRHSIRQWGREMSAPRPYKTNSFHPPALLSS